MTNKELIDKFLIELQVRIVSQQATLGIRASGKSADSLRHETNILSGKLYGEDYFEFQESGRGPTKGSGPGTLRQRIRKWIDDKGINPTDISKDSLSYAITNKIHKEGTAVYRKESKPLPLSEILTQEGQKLKKKIISKYSTEFTNTIKQGFQTLSR